MDDVSPQIWRRIEVESEMPLDFAANAVRCAFGWSSCHISEFKIKGQRYSPDNGWARFDREQELEARMRGLDKRRVGPDQYLHAMREWFEQREPAPLPQDENDEEDSIPTLGELIKRTGTKFTFLYDFGDCWNHTIRVEKMEPAQPKTAYPRCIDGAGANPIEDCGGSWRLTAVIKAIQNPKLPRDEMVDDIVTDWVGEDWDYKHFSVEEANKQFRKTFKRRKG